MEAHNAPSVCIDERDESVGSMPTEETRTRLLRVTQWMMVLGTVRLVATLGDYGAGILDVAASWRPGWSVVVQSLYPLALAILLSSGWPLAIGFVLRRTASRGAMIAAALTFSILGVEGFLSLLLPFYFRSGDPTVSVGSFNMTRGALLHGNPTSVLRALVGSVQVSLELATAIAAWGIYHSCHRQLAPVQPIPSMGSNREVSGRLAVYVSVAFLLITARQPVWSAYLVVLDRSDVLRQFVLDNDVRSHVAHHSSHRAAAAAVLSSNIDMQFMAAYRFTESDRLADAKKVYLGIISMAEASNHDSLQDSRNRQKARLQKAHALNDLAWLLTTCEDPQLREPEQAVSLAKEAVEIADSERIYWNTLGVAYFRVRDWDRASKALKRSMELSNGGEGDAHDWFFLAMISASKNELDDARQWYDRGTAWIHKSERPDQELYRFQVEAAEALRLPKPVLPMLMTQPRPGQWVNPHSIPKKVQRTRSLLPTAYPVKNRRRVFLPYSAGSC